MFKRRFRLPSPALVISMVALSLVLGGTAPENRVAMTAELLIALFIGLSVPVIGAGVALDQGASAPNTVLGFAILVGLGVTAAGWGLLARRPKSSPQVA